MADCPHCETCKHWDQRHQREDFARYELLVAQGSWVVQHDKRERRMFEAEFGDCDALHDAELVKKQDHVDQWWETPLQTHRTFGCALHEPKEAP